MKNKQDIPGGVVVLALAVIVCVILFIATSVRAATVTVPGLTKSYTLSGGYGLEITKWYDSDNGIVCYSVWAGSGSGISCLHN